MGYVADLLGWIMKVNTKQLALMLNPEVRHHLKLRSNSLISARLDHHRWPTSSMLQRLSCFVGEYETGDPMIKKHLNSPRECASPCIRNEYGWYDASLGFCSWFVSEDTLASSYKYIKKVFGSTQSNALLKSFSM